MHDVREGVQAAGPLVSTPLASVYMYLSLPVCHDLPPLTPFPRRLTKPWCRRFAFPLAPAITQNENFFRPYG